MSFEVRINNTNINSHLLSYTRTNNLCEGVGKIKLEVDNNLSASIGNTIVLYENSIKKGEYFLKEIIDIAEEGKKVIDGQDDSWKLENYFITDNITVETAQTNLYYIEWVLNQADVDYSIDVSTSEAQYLEIGTTIGMENAIDLLKNLCRYSAWYFWFDADNTCHISKIKTDIANTSATLNDTNILDISIRFDDKMLRNRGLVYGGANLSTGGYIVGEQTRRTGYEYDSQDVRTVVYSNPNLSYQSSVNTIARKLVDEFAKITVVKDVTLPGYWNLKINDSIFLESKYYTGAGLIMAIESSASDSGMLTKLTLDSRCPKLVTFFEHDYVYIGTEGMGVWRKPYTIVGSWENYSNGINSEDLYIKDLKINNGVFVCIGGNNAYYRTVNTNWTKINLPPEYLNYYATGIVIDNVDNNFYISYTDGQDSIEVKCNSNGSILYINPIYIDDIQSSALVLDIDLYNRSPVATTGDIAGIYPPEGPFVSYFPMNNYALFSNKIITFYAHPGGISIQLYEAVTKILLQSTLYIPPYYPARISCILTYMENSNTCKFAAYGGSKIYISEYSVPSNTVTFIKEISTPVSSQIIYYADNILFTRDWAFDLKTESFLTFGETLIGNVFCYYARNRKIVHLNLYNVSIYNPPYTGDYPGIIKKQQQRAKITIFDLDRFTIRVLDDLIFPEIDWSSDIWVYLLPPFSPKSDEYRQKMYFSESYSGKMYLSIVASRKQRHVTYFFGVPSGFDYEINDFNYIIIDLNTGNFTFRPLTPEEFANSPSDFSYVDSNPWITSPRIPSQAHLSDNGRKISIFKVGVRPFYNGYFDIFSFEKTINYTPNTQFEPRCLVPIAGLDYYMIVNHRRPYDSSPIYWGNVYKVNIDDIEKRPIPYTVLFEFSAEAGFFFSLVCRVAYVDYYGWVLHFSNNLKAFGFRVNLSGPPSRVYNTIYKTGESYSIIDSYLDPSVLENSQEGIIFTYPINENAYPESIRASFIPEFGEFYTISGSTLTSLTGGNQFLDKITDARLYYENENYYGFSAMTLSGQEDRFMVSIVNSGILKTTGIDFLDDFSDSQFSGVLKIETSNYSDLYFLNLSGNLFYQKVYPSTSFVLANTNIPSSNITIIRLDDRL